MRVKFITGLLILLPLLGFSQGEWNNWCFGQNAAMKFIAGSPQAVIGSALIQSAGGTSITVSDSLGNLLFSCNGWKIWDRNNAVMPNGSGILGGNICSQPVFCVPKADNPDQYYLFTVGQPDPFSPPIVGLRYSLVDMRLNNGFGDIVNGFKNVIISSGDSAVDQITGTRHKNNKDVWVVVRKHGPQTKYLAYLVSGSGINLTPVVSSSQLPVHFTTNNPPAWKTGGDLKISPDGTRLVCSDSLTELCEFNSLTGAVTPKFVFHAFGARGAEFSVDSKFLYLCVAGDQGPQFDNPGWQYNLAYDDSLSFVQSQVELGGGFGSKLQLGPDTKIYCGANPALDSLHCINNPGLPGLSCNYQRNAVGLAGNQNNQCLVQFLQKYKAYIHQSHQCFLDTAHFWGDIWPPADTTRWNFGDPASGASNVSTLTTPSHLYANPGTYTVTLYVRHNDNRTDTTRKSITIFESPQPVLGPDSTLCNGQSITFDAGSCSGCFYQWANLATGQMNIGNGQTFTATTAGIYMTTVTNPAGCIGRDTVTVTLGQPVTISVTILATSVNICQGSTVTFTATATNPGNSPIYQWKVNGTGMGTNSPVFTLSPANGDIITCELTSSLVSCISANPVISNAITMTVSPILPVSVSVTASANNVCTGTTVTFTAVPVNGGLAPSYQWKVNGIPAGTNSPVYTYVPMNNDAVTCILNSSETCALGNPATSPAVIIIVNPQLPVSVSISASSNPFCTGTPVSFTASPINGGPLAVYQWKVNGVNAGVNAPVYSYNPVSGDVVTCLLTSSLQCLSGNPAVSNAVTMTGTPGLPASVAISASSNPFCPGSAVTFTATPINGGSNPSYQWKVNEINTGTNSASFSYVPANNDSVRCVITSNLSCVTGNPASSAKIIMIGTLAPSVAFSACFDTVTTVNAKPFQLKGGLPIGGIYSGPGVNSSTGIFTPSVAGIGVKTINYSYINVHDCGASKSKSIMVQPYPSFTCGNNLIDTRDNKVYPTVQIGTQCWMSKNLDFGLAIASTIHQVDNCIAEKYCYIGSVANCTQYGGLYQWDEMMKFDDTPAGQGLCPPGWHVPTESEWTTLMNYYLGNGRAGRPLQDTIINGFKALRSGVFYLNSSWSFLDFATILWSSTSSGQSKAISHGMNSSNFSVSLYPASRANAFGVRCLLD